MVADREVLPVRQQRLLVRAEDPADVGGVRLGGVEVDVVADLERHPQRHVGQRHQVRLDVPAAGLVAQQGGDPAPYGGPRVAALRHQRVERGRGEDRRQVQLVRRGDRRQVEHLVADPHAHPRGVVPAHEHAVRQVVDVVRRSGSAVDPGAAHVRGGHTSSSSPVLMSSSRGSVTEQEPNEVNQRRPPPSSVSKASPDQRGLVLLLEDRDHVVARGAVEGVPGGDQDVEEAVVLEAGRGVAVAQRAVQPGRALERCLAVEGGVDPGAPAPAPTGRRGPRCHRCGTSAAARRRRPRRRRRASRRWAVRRSSGPAAARRGSRIVAQLVAHLVDGGHHAPGVAGEVVEVAQRDLEAGDLQAQALRQPDRSGDLAGAAGHHHGQRAAEAAHQRQVGVAEHERPDEAGVPLLATGGVRRGRLVQGGVAGREDGGVVDEARARWDPGRMASTSSRGYSSHEAHCGHQ